VLTVADYFCGAGGSSTGMEQVPGVRVRIASNHWQLAVDTHNANFPHADHDREDITRIDPRRHPSTDIGWFSPECTNWSVAKGVRCDYDGKPVQLDLFGTEEEDRPLPDEAAQRSRMLMQDVPRFTEVHRYRAVVVENVTDILKWAHLDEWLTRMRLLGYAHRTVILNSAFATVGGPGAPQLRDRVYFVFWREEYPTPDFPKWTRPRAWCRSCGDVRALYIPKSGSRRAMRYGVQYCYRCPSVSCRGRAVQPYCLPAAAAIDWTLPGRRIGDRTTPLRPKTLTRITDGLARWSNPLLVPSGGTWNTTARPVGQPMRARTTRETEALLIPVEGRDGKQARTAAMPLRAQTARAQDALVVPLRNHGIARPAAAHPLVTFAAGGTHQALLYGYDTGTLRPAATTPLPAQTTVAGDALLTAGTPVRVEDCTFRMLAVDEIRAGMAFTLGYRLNGSKRGARISRCLRRGRSDFWDGCPPTHRRPRRSRADLPQAAKVVRPVGRSTLAAWGRPAPQCVGRRRTGWR
jgi:DNA (cytosine-5)-methyltransferase 1